jgi:hypothetical protein
MSEIIRLWFWIIADELTGKRRKTTWRMTEEDATRYAGAVNVEGSLEERQPMGNTSDLVSTLLTIDRRLH